MLSFARDPQGFINDWLQSQCRDLKVQNLGKMQRDLGWGAHIGFISAASGRRAKEGSEGPVSLAPSRVPFTIKWGNGRTIRCLPSTYPVWSLCTIL